MPSSEVRFGAGRTGRDRPVLEPGAGRQARAQLDLGQYAAAGTTAAQVTAGFVYNIESSITTTNQYNGIYTLASYTEAQLIVAEAQLAAGNYAVPVTGTLAILNALRATVTGLAPLAPAVGAAAQQDQLFRERAFKGNSYGTDVNFPVPKLEENNQFPRLPRSERLIERSVRQEGNKRWGDRVTGRPIVLSTMTGVSRMTMLLRPRRYNRDGSPAAVVAVVMWLNRRTVSQASVAPDFAISS